MTPFNRVVVPTAELAAFLRTEENEKLTFTELQSLLYDRLYRSGSVRHLNGSRAHRKRARDRQARNRRTVGSSAQSRSRSRSRSRQRAAR
jgi:hypothetical protein